VIVVLLIAASTLFSSQALADRHVSEEALVFRRVKAGVVTVFGDQGSGSGFLVDSVGVILTNDHVVGGSHRIRVKFDDSTRVDATFLASDPKRDIAAIWVAPSIARRYVVLPLAQPSDTMVVEGEKVVAIGSPLHQEKIMTSGIVSKVLETAIISDVNINHGNSGGPLLNMDGEVVAINTFGDFTTQGGPGVSGSVLISEARPLLDKVGALTSGPSPSDALLPIAPREPFPLDSLEIAAQLGQFNPHPYRVSEFVDTGKFNVTVVTPIYDAWRQYEVERLLTKKMHKREQKGNVPQGESYEPAKEMRAWMRYTEGGSAYAAVVTIEFAPKIGQTKGSLWSNVLGATAAGMSGYHYRGAYKYEFKSDFKDVSVTRDGKPVPDVLRAKVMVPLVLATSDLNGDYSGEDMAREGIFQCTSDWFAPDSARAAKIHFSIASVEKPDQPYEFDLPEGTRQRIWDDFESFRRASGSAPNTHEIATASTQGNAAGAAGSAKTDELTIEMKDGSKLTGKTAQPWGEQVKIVSTEGRNTFVYAGKVYSITSADGHDWTKALLQNGMKVPPR